ncbi:unnamed protein product [Paramecium primaurelia]|uniref:Uncharacterized protein n=1 Tax=Paramecium primaurelia TaxID=5886 RepID=A0A8S1NG67_PARPR|nr:unnamed protein product [Paramecium primaurelia]
MNLQCEEPFQYRQLRSQSLSPYNDSNLIKQLKRQLHYPPQKTILLQSFEYLQNQEQIETNIISSDSMKHYQKTIKGRKNSLIFEADSYSINQNVGQSEGSNQFNKIVPKVIVVKNLQQKLAKRKQQPINPINPQDCNDEETIQHNIVGQNQNNGSTIETKREHISLLPQIKKSKILMVDEQPIKRSARYEQLMKKTCDDQLIELQSLIKKMQKQPIIKKEKKVTFLI